MRFATLFLGLSNIAGVFSPTLLTALTSNPQLSAFLGLIGTAQLPSNLTNATILAPSNQAFAALSNVTIQALASSPRLLNQVVSLVPLRPVLVILLMLPQISPSTG